MITILYRLIALLIVILTTVNIFKKTKIRDQINGAVILIPLILRILMIK